MVHARNNPASDVIPGLRTGDLQALNEAQGFPKALSSSGQTKDSIIALDGDLDWPTAQGQTLAQKSTSDDFDISVVLQNHDEIQSLKDVGASPANKARTYARTLDNISGLTLSESIRNSLANSQSSELQEAPTRSKPVASTTHTPKANNALVERKEPNSDSKTGTQTTIYGKLEDIRTIELAGRVLSGFKRKLAGSRRQVGNNTNEERLGERIFEALVQSHDPHVSFLPRSELEKFVTQQSVDQEVQRLDNLLRKCLRMWKTPAEIRIEVGESPNSIESAGPDANIDSDRPSRHAHKLQKRKTYRKIFAILLLIEQPFRIWSFVEEGVCDDDLPLVKIQRTKGSQHRFRLCRKDDPKTPLLCFKKWKHGAIVHFAERQWKVLAPCFARPNGKDVPHLELQPEEILPFTSWEKTAESGGFGQVYKVEIHGSHHAFQAAEEPGHVFAVKELFSKSEQDHMQESEILRNLSSERHTHPHLITLLGTYEQHGSYHLIFPWAEADLETYWQEKNPVPSHNGSMAVWLIEQCQGIAEGLSKVHHYLTLSESSMLPQRTRSRKDSKEIERGAQSTKMSGTGVVRRLFGRHGDIKPNNILWFPDRGSQGGHGILKITDFGIARFSTENKVSARERGHVPNSLTYRSPECDLADGELSSQCDIWALGCVYLVFVTWYFGGRKLLEDFARRRLTVDPFWHGLETDTFFVIEKEEQSGVSRARVKDSVIKMIDELGSHHACNNFFREFLDMIKQDMLVVQKSGSKRKEESNGNGDGDVEVEPHRANSSGTLAVPGQERSRRKSSSNIARDLGGLIMNIPGYVARPTSLASLPGG